VIRSSKYSRALRIALTVANASLWLLIAINASYLFPLYLIFLRSSPRPYFFSCVLSLIDPVPVALLHIFAFPLHLFFFSRLTLIEMPFPDQRFCRYLESVGLAGVVTAALYPFVLGYRSLSCIAMFHHLTPVHDNHEQLAMEEFNSRYYQ